jgi:hypothetical protein
MTSGPGILHNKGGSVWRPQFHCRECNIGIEYQVFSKADDDFNTSIYTNIIPWSTRSRGRSENIIPVEASDFLILGGEGQTFKIGALDHPVKQISKPDMPALSGKEN